MSTQTENSKHLKCIVIILLAVMAVSILALIGISLTRANGVKSGTVVLEGSYTQESQYGLAPYRDVTALSAFDEDGTAVAFSAMRETPSVMLFWASWCPKCTIGFDSIVKLSETLKQQGVTLYLVNKTDGTLETLQKAKAYLNRHVIDTPALYDDGLVAYKGLGLSKIPTVVVLNNQGRLINYAEGFVPEVDMLLAMVQEARAGKAATVQQFIASNLLNDDGGVRTNYLDSESDTPPSGGDVLSESQGLMMLSAAAMEERELFDRLWDYTKSQSTGGSLCAWVTTKDGPSSVNAAIDDLRIYRALSAAQARWGSYSKDIKLLAQGLYQYNTDGKNLYDFHDFSLNSTAQRLTLCYADFEALEMLAQEDGKWRTIYKNSLEIVEKGKISADFPLYHSYYDYSTNTYVSDKLNMAEAMVTLLNLSRVSKLDPQSLQWLRARLDEGAIYAQYSTNGRPTLEGRYESTAVYALCALIALSQDEPDMARQALSHLEALKIRTSSSKLNGGFGNADGSGIYSFDQCMALLAYQQMERFIQ